MDEQSRSGATAAGLLRRLGALFYDCLLLLAILFAGTFALLPLTGGEAITPASQGVTAYLAYRGYLALLALGYFGFAWTRGGRTLGMMAWRLRFFARDSRAVPWDLAARRFGLGLALAAVAEFGMRLAFAPGVSARIIPGILLLLPVITNFAWIPFEARGRSLQDLACRMEMLRE
jgi:uncharacterized RDD family membrane protein YckC